MDALESRVVSSSSSTALYAKLRSLSEKLDLLEAQLAPTNVKGLRHAVDALTAAVDLQVRCTPLLMLTDQLNRPRQLCPARHACVRLCCCGCAVGEKVTTHSTCSELNRT